MHHGSEVGGQRCTVGKFCSVASGEVRGQCDLYTAGISGHMFNALECYNYFPEYVFAFPLLHFCFYTVIVQVY